MSRTEDSFKGLVRWVVRAFYWNIEPAGMGLQPGRKEGDTAGLPVLIIDVLTSPGTEWIKEQRIADSLLVDAHQVRAVLKILHAHHIVHRDKLSLPRDPSRRLTDEERKKADYYCCVDYPGVVDMVRLRIRMMRRKLQEGDQRNSEPKYYCHPCYKSGAFKNEWSAYDLPLILQAEGDLQCPQCGSELLTEQQLLEKTTGQDEGPAGPGGGEGELRLSAQERKVLLRLMDKQLAELESSILVALEGHDPPDYGSKVREWSVRKRLQAEQAQRERAERERLTARPRDYAGGAGGAGLPGQAGRVGWLAESGGGAGAAGGGGEALPWLKALSAGGGVADEDGDVAMGDADVAAVAEVPANEGAQQRAKAAEVVVEGDEGDDDDLNWENV
ncbi:unnamed protein product [Pedinophyceae sp. YPF-701]|nr:unnamed protein product [Pedinophyceae sp. YPF-701]